MAEKGMVAAGGQAMMGQKSDGTLDFIVASVQTANVTPVNSSATSQQALAANTARKGFSAYNTDANACFLKFGETASATSFTVKIPAEGYYEMPEPIYTGRIDVIWAADGGGILAVTELT